MGVWEPQRLTFARKALTCTYDCAYISTMFEWDKSKARRNEAKHGISFADTFGVFEDSNAMTLEQHVRGEN